MSLFVVGDLHGNATGEMQYLNTSMFPEQKAMTKEDVVINLGDFGFSLISYRQRKRSIG